VTDEEYVVVVQR